MDNKDVTAQWARETAEGKLGPKAEAQLNMCLVSVKSAVNRNELTVNIDEWIEVTTKKELEKRGFKVECHDDQREGSWTTISW